MVMVGWLHKLRHRGMAFQTVVLGVVVLAVFALAGPVAAGMQGAVAVRAAALAGVLCWAGATVALAIGRTWRGSHLALPALLAGMSARMGIPLVFALAIHLHGGPLAEAGLLYYLLVFYPATLVAETALSLPDRRQPMPCDQTSPNCLP
jgi:hypothetical protein